MGKTAIKVQVLTIGCNNIEKFCQNDNTENDLELGGEDILFPIYVFNDFLAKKHFYLVQRNKNVVDEPVRTINVHIFGLGGVNECFQSIKTFLGLEALE